MSRTWDVAIKGIIDLLRFYFYSYVVSGEADGRVCFWDWKTKKIWNKFKAHDGVCICAKWLPHETSKVLTCGWDGAVKLWDWGLLGRAEWINENVKLKIYSRNS